MIYYSNPMDITLMSTEKLTHHPTVRINTEKYKAIAKIKELEYHKELGFCMKKSIRSVRLNIEK